MKIVVFTALLLSAFVAVPALAADKSKMSVGASYGLGGVSGSGGVFSGRLDYDISDTNIANHNPVKARFGFDHYAVDFSGWGGGAYTWSYNVFYAGAYYDLNKQFKLDSKIHPFVGLGFGIGTASCSGSLCSGVTTPSSGGLYWIGGVQYQLTPQVDAEVGFSGWAGLSIGANFKF